MSCKEQTLIMQVCISIKPDISAAEVARLINRMKGVVK